MKRASLVLMSLLFFVLSITFVSDAFAYDTVSVCLDGKEIDFDVQPCIVDGRTLVPIRGVLEAFGAEVSWDNIERKTVATKDDTIISIGVDNPVMTVCKDGKTYVSGFDVPPRIIEDRTFVAIKSIADAFDIGVAWNANDRKVVLASGYKISDTPNIINLSGFIPPKTTNVGCSYSISGYVSADGIIDRLNIKITDILTGKIQINETAFGINKNSYHISDIDNRIKFGTLSIGAKHMEITVVTKNETRKIFNYDFEVLKPTGEHIKDEMSMLWPVPSSGFVTTIFWCDNTECHSNAGRINGHAAIDIAAAENADVISVKDGIVIKTGFGDHENGYSGYGNFIVVDHGNGITTQYSHLYSIYVSEGDVVSAGQVIGGVGNTGYSTGNHLDFNIEKNGKRCDPLYYLDIHPEIKCFEECDKPYFKEAMEKRGIIVKE